MSSDTEQHPDPDLQALDSKTGDRFAALREVTPQTILALLDERDAAIQQWHDQSGFRLAAERRVAALEQMHDAAERENDELRIRVAALTSALSAAQSRVEGLKEGLLDVIRRVLEGGYTDAVVKARALLQPSERLPDGSKGITTERAVHAFRRAQPAQDGSDQ